MKRSKYCYLFFMLLLCFAFVKPVQTEAASVSVTYNSKKTSYGTAKTTAYINGKKLSISKTPSFKKPVDSKTGWYMGSATEMLKNSALKVKMSTTTKTITLTYNSNVLKMTNGSTSATLNGKKVSLGSKAYPMKLKYNSSKLTRWVLPMKPVCEFLGIGYKISSGTIYLTKKTTTSASSASTSTTTSSKKVVVVIDAGHGGKDPGAENSFHKNTPESKMTLAILKAAKKYFDKDSRFKVYYTRTTDTYPSLVDRYTLANNKKADLFISIHINSAGSSATGTETCYSLSRAKTTKKNGVTSTMLATAMQKATVAATGFRNRGLSDRPNLKLLKYSKMPACLIEYGFISNKKEEASMYANTSKYGKALYNGLVKFVMTNKMTASN